MLERLAIVEKDKRVVALGARMPGDGDRSLLHTFLVTVGMNSEASTAAWLAEFEDMTSPDRMHGTPVDGAILAKAMRQYIGDGFLESTTRPSIRHFSAYVTTVAAGDPLPRQRTAPSVTSATNGTGSTNGTHPAAGGAGGHAGPQSGPSVQAEAQQLVAMIRALITTNQAQAGPVRYIPKAKVEAIGPHVLQVYEAVGGATRFLEATGDKISFLIRDVAVALSHPTPQGGAP